MGSSDAALDAALNVDGGAAACAARAQAMCNSINVCYPFEISIGFGDLTTCIATSTERCLNLDIVPGTPNTPAAAQKCASELATITGPSDPNCDKLVRWRLENSNDPTFAPDCFASAGNGALGGACANDRQCQSGYCNTPDGVACGQCTTRLDVGGACTVAGDCKPGLGCSVNGGCAAYGNLNDACDDDHPCHPTSLRCSSGTCAPPGDVGAACAGVFDCDFYKKGISCNIMTMRCEAILSAIVGAACGFSDSGSYTVCSSDSNCQYPSSTSTKGTCVQGAQLGQACDGSGYGHPACVPPLSCVAAVCQPEGSVSTCSP